MSTLRNARADKQLHRSGSEVNHKGQYSLGKGVAMAHRESHPWPVGGNPVSLQINGRLTLPQPFSPATLQLPKGFQNSDTWPRPPTPEILLWLSGVLLGPRDFSKSSGDFNMPPGLWATKPASPWWDGRATVQCLRLCPPLRRCRCDPLGWEPRSHRPPGQKTKTSNKSSAESNSDTVLKEHVCFKNLTFQRNIINRQYLNKISLRKKKNKVLLR